MGQNFHSYTRLALAKKTRERKCCDEMPACVDRFLSVPRAAPPQRQGGCDWRRALVVCSAYNAHRHPALHAYRAPDAAAPVQAEHAQGMLEDSTFLESMCVKPLADGLNFGSIFNDIVQLEKVGRVELASGRDM
jgi:hypothetical protein